MKRKHPKKTGTRPRRIARALFLTLGVLFLLGALSLLVYAKVTLSPEYDELLFHKTGQEGATRLYYDGDPATQTFDPVLWESETRRTGALCLHTPLSEIPEHVKDAFIAIEDHRFYRHVGVDFLRTGKAVLYRIFRGKGGFGGSTITQQLIKNIGGEAEKTVSRKVREMLRAVSLEGRHSKDEILEAYLNIVPMGAGCVGVGAAAERYFGKPVGELSLSEAASLAAITRAPARLSPHIHPEENRARRDVVLARMAELGLIDADACARASAEPLRLAEREEGALPRYRSWYAERVLWEVERDLRELGYTESAVTALLSSGGLCIETALDPEAQRAAESAFVNSQLSKTYGEGFHAGVCVFSPQTGKLVALVGDLGEKRGEGLFSYATDMRRAPGSVLKPIALYAPALEEGRITEATVFDDVPRSFDGGTAWPRNSPARYDGLILAKDALALSKNTVAVALYRQLGAEHIYANLRERFLLSGLVRRTTDASGAVRTDLAEAPLALGQLTYGESLFSMTRAYLPLAAAGRMSEGDTYYRVTDASGRVLLEREEGAKRVLSEQSASVLTHMLLAAVEEGSGKGLSLSEIVPTAGKTGSSGGNRDRWFIGYTPAYLCGVWCGYESGERAVTGTPHLSLFDAVMLPLHERRHAEEQSFPMASGLVARTVCRDSGKMLTDGCHLDARGDRAATVWVPRTEVLTPCDTHVCVWYDDEGGGVVYPPRKGSEGKERRVSLVRTPPRAFPFEVVVTDAEYVWRDPLGTTPLGGNTPFFSGALRAGVFIGKSHDGRPFNAASERKVPAPPEREPADIGDAPEEGKRSALPKRSLPALPRRRLPRLPFFGFH